jgi:hypothetical protein
MRRPQDGGEAEDESKEDHDARSQREDPGEDEETRRRQALGEHREAASRGLSCIMPLPEHPELPVLTRDEAQRIRACHVVHAWISAPTYATLELQAGCRGMTVDRLVSIMVTRVTDHCGAVEAIVPAPLLPPYVA